jgi:hypothetical protein
MNIKRSLKYFYQRLTRGWDDSDTWSLDVTIAKFALPRLKRLKEIQHGHPSDFTEQDWDKALDEMIWAMEYITKQWDLDLSMEQWQDNEKRCSAGCILFGMYFRALWD